jgi:eukaryotic-like serine/threonine-protein kinase
MSDDPGADPDRTKVSVIDPLAGKVLDNRYRIEYRLAQGGFGSVYRARHVINGREVALKVLHPQHAGDSGVAARFRREARALGQLKNPHTITAYDFGEAPDGTLYIVMELLQGESLYEQYRAHGALPWRRIVTIMRSVCSSLAEAHALGIVHRDLKPANIHLEKRGDIEDYVKVLDFGIAKILYGNAADTAGLTHAGQVIGTFDYMAPEQLVGGAIDGRSDIFTLGVVMYETIGGELPFGTHATNAAMISSILAGPPTSLSSHAEVPDELDAIVARCLSWEPDGRFRSVIELANELSPLLAGDDERTKTRIERAPSFGGEDSTWLDETPEPVDLFTTLPGVVPPKRRR